MKIIKTFLIRTPTSQYKSPKNFPYDDIAWYLKYNTPKKTGGRLKGLSHDYILENIKYVKNRIIYYFVEVDKK